MTAKFDKRAFTWLAAPLCTALLLLAVFALDGAWPFGGGSVSWCDMDQQVLPLLADFKDILAGREGLFLNLPNAGGMDLWSVFFFFLASPFSFLVAFVPKTELFHFANLLVLLKLTTCAGTAAFCLRKKFERLDPVWVAALGMLYALSGYGMLYYQNVIWLDMMALFPLLILSLDALCERGRILPYTAVLAAMMVVNYYIGYMVVVFLMLFIGLTLLLRKDGRRGVIAWRFSLGSLLAALTTAVVWLPCLLQYGASGRIKDTFFGSVERADLLSHYETAWPTVLCTALPLVATAAFLLFGGDARCERKRLLLLAGLTVLPLLVEPINLMWHTGNYMAFPSRFGFMTEFLLVMASASYLCGEKPLRKKGENPVLLVGLLTAAAALLWMLYRYVDLHREEATAYARTLWGNAASLRVCLLLFGTLAILFAVMLALWRKGFLSARSLAVLCTLLIAGEGLLNARVYMTEAVARDAEKASRQATFYDLADRLEEDELFRVTAAAGLGRANDVGALGYPALGHYTSLNRRAYMDMMKELGHGSNWMDVANWSGTELTDLLWNVKYEIVRGSSDNAVYRNGTYSIVEKEHFLPSGLLVGEVDEDLPAATRGEIQQWVAAQTLGAGEAVSRYELPGTATGTGYAVRKGANYTLTLTVEGKRTLYADAWDGTAVSLGGPLNGGFSLAVDGRTVRATYPDGNVNGLFRLGEFEDQTVTLTFTAKKDMTMRSLGVVAVDADALFAAAEKAATVGFVQDGGTLKGSVTASSGQNCLLALPFTDELRVKINGKSVSPRRALGDMTLIPLAEGVNEIVVTARPAGWIPGLLLTLAGLALCVLWAVFGKKIRVPAAVGKGLTAVLFIGSAAVFAAVYLLPLVVWLKARL